MKLLITGHKGFIGSCALSYFKKHHEIVGYEYNNDFPNLDQDFDYVLHFGAISSTTERNVDKILKQNFDFSCRLIEECNARGINFQYSSSASVYGLNKSFKETDPVDPRTPYAWSKYLFERYVQSKEWNIRTQGFRYFNVYSDGEEEKGKGNQASPFYQFTLQAITENRIKVFDKSDTYFRDFVPVETVIDIHDQFLYIDKSGIWNVGTGTTRSFMDIAVEIAKKHSACIEMVTMPETLKHSYQTYTCADLSFLQETLNEKNSGKWHV